jgi:hypothetical protein
MDQLLVKGRSNCLPPTPGSLTSGFGTRRDLGCLRAAVASSAPRRSSVTNRFLPNPGYRPTGQHIPLVICVAIAPRSSVDQPSRRDWFGPMLPSGRTLTRADNVVAFVGIQPKNASIYVACVNVVPTASRLGRRERGAGSGDGGRRRRGSAGARRSPQPRARWHPAAAAAARPPSVNVEFVTRCQPSGSKHGATDGIAGTPVGAASS